ncbi:D-alanyl-lipoteichoic acid biosynthesis protein DltD [Streptococcus gwangjuensis]|uniref:D-alanyl-lipoteichoic acid biosynthesis protein DltD n=1 Tax=Streptococcus gwangjuensis TaxID=1433513 RepID=A0A387B601_9STRE|nr:D-alanyl-lipoteichoic acid biosynthesis protein DltD [Streptococcus gwangjuense]AYF96625.1 D-alanyl-lipoteichoic acid biosynthesis protein DltD [Streptococcus gwangjuense]
MIKLKAFLLSLVLVIATLALLNVTYVKKIDDYYKVKDNSIRYSTSYEKYKSRDILTSNITPNTFVLLGSSELVATINEDYHPNKIFNYNDFNIMQIGTSYSQNIIQATTLGSIEGSMTKRKVAIIESVQWFEKDGTHQDAFLNKASQEHIFQTLSNKKISKDTKEKLIDRIIEITKGNKLQNDLYKKYKSYFIEGKGTFIDKKLLELDNTIYSFKLKQIFYQKHAKSDYPSLGDKTPDYDWEKMTNQFVEEVKKKTDNNDYAVDNNYYNTYLKDRYASLKDSNKDLSYLESPEYSDMELFLTVAKELGIEVEVIIFPVNGKWNDYTGVSREMREKTYKKIEDVAKSYGATVLNYGNREYDDYFLFDVMHVGVKGWMEVEKELYKFANQDN